MAAARPTLLLTTALLVAGVLVGTVPAAAASPSGAGAPPAPAGRVHDVSLDPCAPHGPLPAGQAQCFAQQRRRVVTTSTGRTVPAATTSGPVGGITPKQLRTVYGVPTTTAPAGTTVGIVDAFDTPTVAADLATFRATYGLGACTVANGCFREVDQRGSVVPPNKATTSTVKPVYNSSWQFETTMDVEAVSAMCPSCSILLVEADDADLQNSLGPAVSTAVRLGATVVSNSFGGGESGAAASADAYWRQQPVPIFAATGDYAFKNLAKPTGDPSFNYANYPASSAGVVAVGGTSMRLTSTGTVGSEAAWPTGGSGCSVLFGRSATQGAYFAAQHVEPYPNGSGGSNCVGLSGTAARAGADVAAIADVSAPGFPVVHAGSWSIGGGTSLATPLVAALQALAGPRGTETSLGDVAYGLAARGVTTGLTDVTTGTNRTSAYGCSGARICTAGPGWDGPTGLGTPRGTALFTSLLTVTPTTSVPGGTVGVSGAHFVPGELVDITSAGAVLGAPVTVGSGGTVAAAVALPVGATGAVPVTVTGRTSGFTATRTVATTPPSVTLAAGAGVVPLASLAVRLAGFAAGEQVDAGVTGGGAPSSVRVAADGTGSTTVLVPATASCTVTVTATGETSGRTATSGAATVVAAALSPATLTAHPGDVVTLSAVGYGSREDLVASVGTVGATAGADGTATVVWTVPTGSLGTTPVVLTGRQTGRTVVAWVDVLAAGPSAPAPPAAPTLLSVVPLVDGTSVQVAVRVAPTGTAATSVRVFTADGRAVATAGAVSGSGDAVATVTGLTTGVATRFVAVAGGPGGDSARSAPSAAVVPNTTPGTGDLTPVTPVRRLDPTAPTATVGAAASRSYRLTGTAGVPARGVSAVALEITTVAPTAASSLTVWPDGETRPAVTDLSFAAGAAVTTLVVAKLGAGGTIDVYNAKGRVAIALDVVGFYADATGLYAHNGSFAATVPTRVLDTRSAASSPVRSGPGTVTVPVRGGAAGVPADVTAVELSVQALTPAATGSLVVRAGGTSGVPAATDLSFTAGAGTVAEVLAPVAADGTVAVTTTAGTELTVDVVGYSAPSAAGRYVPVSPRRWYDSRTADGPLAAGAVRRLPVAGAPSLDGTSPVPTSATAVTTTLTASGSTARSSLVAWPVGAGKPASAAVVVDPAGRTTTGSATVALGALGATGGVAVATSAGSTQLTLDVDGYYVPQAALPGRRR